MKQHIKDLIEIYLEIVNSPRNQKNKKYRDKVYEWNEDRNNFLKTEIKTCKLFNDEVGSPT